MYLQNKYTTWYYSIIHNARQKSQEGYCEKHHIIPRSLGGDNSRDNIVELSAREHLICHLLLTKMTDGSAKQKMIRAMFLMSNRGRINSRLYETLRKRYSAIRSAEQSGENNHFYGKKHTEESLSKMNGSIQKSLTPARRRQIKFKRTMWRHNQANKNVWAIAEDLYRDWIKMDDPFGFITLEKQYGLKRYSAQNIVSHFVNGWSPLSDSDYQKWRQDYLSK